MAVQGWQGKGRILHNLDGSPAGTEGDYGTKHRIVGEADEKFSAIS